MEHTGFIFVKGLSGSGKTTLMNVSTGIDDITSGSIICNGEKVSSFSEREWENFRNKNIGIVFQNYNLMENLTVYENLEIVLRILSINEEEMKEYIEEALEIVGLPGYGNRQCIELSAGQKQRVAIARAIVKKPKLLWADEAVGNLDSTNSKQILELFDSISKRCLVILISHGDEYAKMFADRIINISNGCIASDIDNTSLKKVYQDDFTITINEGEKKVALNDFDFHEYVKDNVQSENPKVHFDIQVDNKTKKSIQTKNVLDKELSTAKLKSGFFWKMVWNNIRSRKAKTLLSLVLLSFVCSLFLAVSLFQKNDFIKSVARQIENDHSFVKLHKKMSENEYVKRGISFENELEEICEKQKLFKYRVVEAASLKHEMDDLMILYNDNTNPGVTLLEGEWISENDEIVISSSVSELLNVHLGDSISIEEKDCKIAGIVKDTSNICFVSDYFGYRKDTDVKNASFPGVNVTLANDIKEYGSEYGFVGSVSQLNNDESLLIEGRMPEKVNEILLSSEYLKETFNWPQEQYTQNYRIADLTDNKYRYLFNESINLSEFTGKNIKVVGIYDSSKYNDEIGNILFMDQVFEALLLQYNETFSNDGICIYNNNKIYDVLVKLEDSGIRVDDDVCKAIIYKDKDVVSDMSNIIWTIRIVIAVLLILVLIMFLGFRIKEQKRKIGILKAIGYSSKNIGMLYLIENILITIVMIALSVVFAIFMLNGFNFIIMSINQLKDLVIFSYKFATIMGLSIEAFAGSVLVTIIPLIIYSNKKAILLINSGLKES